MAGPIVSWRKLSSGCAACLFAVLTASAALCEGADGTIFSFSVVETREISGRFTVAPGAEIAVDWGDGTRETFGEGQHDYSVDYGQDTDAEVRFYADSEAALTEFSMEEDGADIGFDLGDLPDGMTNLLVLGDNSVTGELADLPGGLTRFRVEGANTITGDIAGLPEELRFFRCTGSNTVTGDTAGLPETLTHFDIVGRNTVYGDLSGLHDRYTYFRARGRNTITGDIADLPERTSYLRLDGDNTVTGNVKDLPEALDRMYLYGNNTVTGEISDLPENLSIIVVRGENTLSGDIGGLPEGIRTVDIRGMNTISGYTPGREWSTGIRTLRIEPAAGHGLGTEEVDNLLIDMARTGWPEGARFSLWLAGNHAPRSGASDEALAALEGKGIPVEVNPPPPPLPEAEEGAAVRTLEELGITITVPDADD